MLQNLQPPVKELLCPLIKRVADLDKKDAEAVLGYIADERWTNSALSIALSENGFAVSETPLWRHRAKRCACAKSK
jgi:hypothetical protein